MITAELPFITPSQNVTRRTHWAVLRKVDEKYMWLTRAELPPVKPKPWPVRLVVQSRRHAYLDYGNLVGGAKGLVDILVRLGYIWDDNPDWVNDTYQQCKIQRKRKPTTIITLERLAYEDFSPAQRTAQAKASGETMQPWQKQEKAKKEKALRQQGENHV